jgi:hypothetical protein
MSLAPCDFSGSEIDDGVSAQLAQLDAPVEQRAHAITELASRLHAATYELLVLLQRFDALNGWSNGFLSCAHWLSWSTGIDLGAAREKVRVARALTTLPRISAAMACGELSYAKVRAITRIATPAQEERLLDVARAGTASQVERIVRAWRRIDRIEEHRLTERRHQNRQVTTWVDDDGMVVIRGRLTPDAGAVVQRALEAAADRLFKEAAAAPANGIAKDVTVGQRRADALALVAECALAGDLDRGTAGDRYQVVVHVDAATLATEHDDTPADDPPQSVVELDSGPVCVSAETAQRLACDASVVVMRHGTDGSVLDVGRKQRTAPAAIRRALAARDRHCQFPGCTARRCDAHHLQPWALGGGTSLDALLLLCRRHHTAVHEGGLRIRRARDGTVTVVWPGGRRLDSAPPVTVWADPDPHPLGPTESRLVAAGVSIGADARPPSSSYGPVKVGWGIEVLYQPRTW